ncbi:MAG TPA: S41 family peptidase [Saprospiraceae bacterium]|nr:S41 family peptidase [Saprospiraceae bacterium]MCC6688318.1 S41 family peptidase [Saprospiraceae bacterium]HMW74253.1 S41 family peptidase [Saprospiraceae bacterium]HMX82722.1 S41 family peptidase [Saprospiraceae bacterium]HMX85637.1 S41 family peptidase [Saprospiraceae bacterium]
MKKIFNKPILIAGFIALTGIAAINSPFVTGNYFEITKNIELFANTFKELNTQYVDELDPGKLMKTGIDAMMKSLDPYTNYYSESQVEGFRYITEGKYNGIGVRFRLRDDYIMIMAPMDGSPAQKAGLKAGDMIMEVDGKSAKGKTEDELNSILQGFPGSEVTLKISRPATGEMTLSVKRDEVNTKNVPHFEEISPNIGYIALTTFTKNAANNILDALKDLKSDNPNLKGLILDLRDNGGGLLNEAVSICNIFVPKSEEIVSTRGKVKDRDMVYRTTMNPSDEKIEIVVLVNKMSASASEIVSGALQDLDRAVIMGQRTFGKGLVQNFREIGYNARIKVTTAKYYVPSGRCIQAVSYVNGEPVPVADSLQATFKTRNGRKVKDGGGVQPDVEIPITDKTDLMKALDDKLMIFDFATDYVNKNPTPVDVKTFSFIDWDAFLKFLKDKKFTYESKTEHLLSQLKTEAEKSKMFSTVQNEYSNLKNKIESEKQKDLAANKDRILSLLSGEIASRFYYEKGRVQVKLKNDNEIKDAVELLNNPAKYNKILK